jgi:DNA-binding transcriptional ArsR family regulator
LKLLILRGRMDIGEIAAELPKDRSVISRHLDFMREAQIVRAEKEGRHVYYEIDLAFVRDKFRAIVDRLDRCCG